MCWSGRGEGKLKSECGEPHDFFTFEQNFPVSVQHLIIVFLAVISVTVVIPATWRKMPKRGWQCLCQRAATM